MLTLILNLLTVSSHTYCCCTDLLGSIWCVCSQTALEAVYNNPCYQHHAILHRIFEIQIHVLIHTTKHYRCQSWTQNVWLRWHVTFGRGRRVWARTSWKWVPYNGNIWREWVPYNGNIWRVLYLANEPLERNWQILIWRLRCGYYSTDVTLHPPENFNLAVFSVAINSQIRQITELKLLPNFPVIITWVYLQVCMYSSIYTCIIM